MSHSTPMKRSTSIFRPRRGLTKWRWGGRQSNGKLQPRQRSVSLFLGLMLALPILSSVATQGADMSRAQGQCIAAALNHDDSIDTVEKARKACVGIASLPQALCADAALGKKHGTISAIQDALIACAKATSEGQVLCAKAALTNDNSVNSLDEALKRCATD